MRSLILPAMLLASASGMAAGDYTETRELSVSANGLEMMAIDAGAGTLDVRGVEGLDTIEVRATIVVPDADADDGRDIIAKDLVLELDAHGGKASLESRFERGFWGFGSNGYVDLEVRAPAAFALDIDDGSGSLEVNNFVSDVTIDDGSGSIDVANVARDVEIDDGSGSIDIEGVGGTVTIDDGSGDIRVSDVGGDLIILDAGSGGLSFSDIRGTVQQED